jgi:hypothetical protein
MDKSVCADVRRWLRQAVLSNDRTLPDPQISMHIAACPHCRGALALLAVEALGLTAALQNITCQRAEEQLPALIEQEAAEGNAAAIRTYPLIWWHIWTCDVCTETYMLTRSLLAIDLIWSLIAKQNYSSSTIPTTRSGPSG